MVSQQNLSQEVIDDIKESVVVKCSNCSRILGSNDQQNGGQRLRLFHCARGGCPKLQQPFCAMCGSMSHMMLDHNFGVDVANHDVVEIFSAMSAGPLVRLAERGVSTINHICEQLKYMQIEKCWDNIRRPMYGASPLLAMAVDFLQISVRFWRGEVGSWKQYGRLLCKSATVGIAGGAGMALGAALGTFVCPVIGTLIGGIIGGILGSKAAGKKFEETWPDVEKNKLAKELSREVLDAIAMFQFTRDQITDSDAFNENTIRRTYRRLALIHHPQRPTGSQAMFNVLNTRLGLLVALANDDAPKHDIQQFVTRSITL